MTNEIVIEADEFNEIGLTLIETTAEAAGSEEIVKLAQYTRRLQSQLAQVTQERGCKHCRCTCVTCAPCGEEEQP